MKNFGEKTTDYIKKYIPDSPLNTIKSIAKSNSKEKRTYPLARNMFPDIFPSIIDFTAQEEQSILEQLSASLSEKLFDRKTSLEGDTKRSFQAHALCLMCACISERSSCSMHDYEQVLLESKKIFGEQALEPLFQAHLHKALLVDYSKEWKRLEIIKDFKNFLENDFNTIDMSIFHITKLYEALCVLSMQKERKKYGIESRFLDEVELVFLEYQVEKRRDRLFADALHGKVSTLLTIAESASTKVIEKIQPNIKEKSLAHKNFNSYNTLLVEKAKVEKLANYEHFALAFRDEDLLEKIQKFRSLLIPQAFRVVMLGEGKRGKSSLINALLGKQILPTRAVQPETGTVIEVSYAQYAGSSPYSIEWLNPYDLERLQKIVHAEEENILLTGKYKELKEALNDANFLKVLESLSIKDSEELRNYSSADSFYSNIIRKISIQLEEDSLPKGVHFVDTPAINASDPFQRYITKEECLKADCLVVLLDSRQPDTHTVVELLKEIAKEGRVVKIIGILSYPHANKEENALAKTRAMQTLSEGIREVSGVELIQVFSFSPKNLLEKIGSKNVFANTKLFSNEEDNEEAQFIETLTHVIEKNRNYSISEERIHSSYTELCTQAEKSEIASLEKNKQMLPNTEHMRLLEMHVKNLEEATESYAKHARSLIQTALHDVEEWRKNTEIFIDHLEIEINNALSKEMHKYADSLGDDFAKASAWEEFDKQRAPEIINTIHNSFLENKNASLKMWEEKIKTFSEEVGKLSIDCFSQIQSSAEELENLFTTHSSLDHALVQANSYMKKIAYLLSGAGGGIFVTSNMANMLFLGGHLAIAVNALALPALSLALGAFTLAKLGNPVKRKKALITRKEEEIARYSSLLALDLNQQANEIQEELLVLYAKALRKSLSPALEMMAYEVINMRLYIEFVKKQEQICLAKNDS